MACKGRGEAMSSVTQNIVNKELAYGPVIGTRASRTF